MATGDGSANAPIGVAQLPNLLAGYVTRPSWEVAGVDYAVGIPSTTVLKDPSTINMAGVEIDTTNHLIRVTGNNVTLDGYNFTGWGVYINGGAQNTTVKDSYFYGGAGIYADSSTVNVSVLDNKFDGGGATNFSSFITLSGTGTKTVDYNWMENSAQHFLELNGGGTVNYSYNLIENGGTAPGAHLNVIQVMSGTYNNAVIANNTIVQTPQSAGGELIQVDGYNAGAVAHNVLIANNTMIAVPTAAGEPSVSYMIDVQSGSTPSTATTGTVQNNYVAYAGGGAYGFNYPLGVNAGNIQFSGNIDMATGKTINGDNSESATSTTPSAPAAPVIASFTNDTGVAGDHITSDSTPTLTGTAVANSTVTIFDGTTKLGTTTANSSGAWSYTAANLADGSHNLTATDTASGTTSTASAALALTIDTAIPNAPVEVGDSVVNGNQVQLTGTAEANSTVKVYDGSALVGTATTGANGNWTVMTSALSVGAHNLTATATDAAGNTSVSSAPLDPVISAASTVPTISSFSNDSGVAGDHITNDSTLTLVGTAVANSTVTVFDGTTQVGTATASGSGAWTITTAKLADGSHSFTATDTVSGGAVSGASSALNVTVDTAAPAAPSLVSDTVVNTNHVLLSGTAEANSTLQVFDGTTEIGTATAGSSGAWTLTTGVLASGSHSFTATATDVAGNTSGTSGALTASISAAGTGSTSGVGSAGGQNLVTNGNFATGDFTGWTLGGNYTSTTYGPEIYIDSNSTGGSTHAASIGSMGGVDGTLSQTIATTSGQTYTLSFWLQNEGSGGNDFAATWNGQKLVSMTNAAQFGYTEYTYTVTATGSTSTLQFSAGNVPSQWDIDNVSLTAATGTTTAPNTPTIASFSTDSGVAGDHITNDNTLTLTGAAVANSTVTVFDGTTKLGTASANSSGAWTFATAKLADGNHNFTATDTVSGTISAASSALAVTIDTHAPTAPTMAIYSQAAATTVAAGSATTIDDFLLKGTAEANSTISVFDAGKQIGTTTANSSGAWSLDTGLLSDGNHSFTSTATDVAGNTSGASAAKGVTIDVPTVIESLGSTSLVEVGNNFYLNSNSTGTGPELKYAGAAVTAGEFGASVAIGVEQTATGYEVAWKIPGADQYAIWTTDSSGNFLANVTGTVSGTNAKLESFETSFHQDLNGDGTIGLPSMVVESLGSTSLVEVGNNFYLNSNSTGTGPELTYGGAAVTAGEFGASVPIGVEQTATGYEVAWKIPGTDQYAIWTTDSNGHFLANVTGTVSGTNAALESFETSFHQDLNGDGVIGNPATSAGSATPKIGLTDLSESAQGLVTLSGTADAGSHVKVYDGTQSMGTVTAGTNGTWSFTSSSAASNTVHTYTAQELDSTGHVVGSSGNAILGSTGTNTLTSTGSNNLFVGNGNGDTFVFASNFGNDVIKDFNANNASSNHDVIQFSKSVFDSFADVLAHATQSGQNVVIADSVGDSLTLKNIKLSALDTHDFHFA